MPHLLEFEENLRLLEAEMMTLRHSDSGDSDDIIKQLRGLEKNRKAQLKTLYDGLSDWQTCLVARHPERPQALEYINALCVDFVELHGDRVHADDCAIVGGLAKFDGRPVALLGQQKGRDTTDKIGRNFGMAGPEGYRKALRIMNLADKFRLPLLTFVDTPGAYPGIGAEERGQAGAIGECLRRLSVLQAPIIVTVIGEGGSGGALALAVGDSVAMLRYAVYSVISPEGCASILWKDAQRTADAAEILSLTAPKLKKLNLIDEIIPEPPGGAQRQPQEAIEAVGESIRKKLSRCETMELPVLLAARQNRWRHYGFYSEARK